MTDQLNIGDAVEVSAIYGDALWHGEIVDWAPEAELARVLCLGSDAESGMTPGQWSTVPSGRMALWGDPDGMRSDGCDDVDVTGRVRPYHRHATTGKAHTHPEGHMPHTHTGQHRDWEQLGRDLAAAVDGGRFRPEVRAAIDPAAGLHDDDTVTIAELQPTARRWQAAAAAELAKIPQRLAVAALVDSLLAGMGMTRAELVAELAGTQPAEDYDRGEDTPCPRCGGGLVDHLLVADADGDHDGYECLTSMASDVLHDMETAEPPGEEQWVAVFRGLMEAHARSLRTQLGPVITAEPGTTDQRDRHHEAMERQRSADRAAGDWAGLSHTAHVFALLRDIADREPLTLVYSMGQHPREIRLTGHQCAVCGAQAEDRTPVDHLVSCPWVRVTQLVGVKADG